MPIKIEVESILKEAGDVIAATIIGVSWLGYLPEIAAGLAAFWTFIRIGEWVWVRILRQDPLKPIQKIVENDDSDKTNKKDDKS